MTIHRAVGRAGVETACGTLSSNNDAFVPGGVTCQACRDVVGIVHWGLDDENDDVISACGAPPEKETGLPSEVTCPDCRHILDDDLRGYEKAVAEYLLTPVDTSLGAARVLEAWARLRGDEQLRVMPSARPENLVPVQLAEWTAKLRAKFQRLVDDAEELRPCEHCGRLVITGVCCAGMLADAHARRVDSDLAAE